HPDRNQIEVGGDDPERELDDAVAGDVEQRAEQARLVALAGDVAVEPIRDEDQNDQEEAREMPCVDRLVSEPDDQEQQDQPAQRHEIGHADDYTRAFRPARGGRSGSSAALRGVTGLSPGEDDEDRKSTRLNS